MSKKKRKADPHSNGKLLVDPDIMELANRETKRAPILQVVDIYVIVAKVRAEIGEEKQRVLAWVPLKWCFNLEEAKQLCLSCGCEEARIVKIQGGSDSDGPYFFTLFQYSSNLVSVDEEMEY